MLSDGEIDELADEIERLGCWVEPQPEEALGLVKAYRRAKAERDRLVEAVDLADDLANRVFGVMGHLNGGEPVPADKVEGVYLAMRAVSAATARIKGKKVYRPQETNP